jgi:hypothetical protein
MEERVNLKIWVVKNMLRDRISSFCSQHIRPFGGQSIDGTSGHHQYGDGYVEYEHSGIFYSQEPHRFV